MRNSKELTEYRCKCGKLLFRGCLVIGSVEIKCKRCGKIKLFESSYNDVIGQYSNLCGNSLPKSTRFNFFEYGGKKYAFTIL